MPQSKGNCVFTMQRNGNIESDTVTICWVVYSDAIYMFENSHSVYAQSAEMLICMIEKLMLKLQTHTGRRKYWEPAMIACPASPIGPMVCPLPALIAPDGVLKGTWSLFESLGSRIWRWWPQDSKIATSNESGGAADKPSAIPGPLREGSCLPELPQFTIWTASRLLRCHASLPDKFSRDASGLRMAARVFSKYHFAIVNSIQVQPLKYSKTGEDAWIHHPDRLSSL